MDNAPQSAEDFRGALGASLGTLEFDWSQELEGAPPSGT